MRQLVLAASAAFILATAAHAQSEYSTGRWKFAEAENGDLGAEVWTEVGHGLQVHIAFQCNEGGRYSNILHSGVPFGLEGELKAYVDSFVSGDLRIETFRAGQRTNSFRPTGFHQEGDEVTDARLRSLQDADFVLVTGGKRPIAFSATNAKIAIAQYIAACGVLRPK